MIPMPSTEELREIYVGDDTCTHLSNYGGGFMDQDGTLTLPDALRVVTGQRDVAVDVAELAEDLFLRIAKGEESDPAAAAQAFLAEHAPGMLRW